MTMPRIQQLEIPHGTWGIVRAVAQKVILPTLPREKVIGLHR